MNEQNPEFTPQDIENWLADARQDIEIAQSVRSTLESEGWQKHIVPMMNKFLKQLQNFDGVESYDQFLAQKKVVETFTKFQLELNKFLDIGQAAKAQVEQIEAVQKQLQ
jgi:hypothetical protein